MPVPVTPTTAPQVPAAPAKPPYTEISIASQNRRIPVIMYHDVIAERGKDAQWFDCSREEFEAQMKFFQDNGAVPISMKDLYDHLTTGKEVPEGAVVLTFDDNYQGFYDIALPILQQYNYPSTMFVHTGFVGDKTGLHPKMDWPTLKELVKNPLVTIGSHTITHPDDISKLTPEQQTKELVESKATLERELGVPMEFIAYPNGKNDKTTQELTKAAGYKMAFSIDNGLAQESPSIYCVNRYVHTRLENAWEDRDRALRGGALGIFQGEIKESLVGFQELESAGVKLALITGGLPTTVTSETREGVLDFVKRTKAVAGINGTFFAMAAIKSTDNKLVGPCKTPEMPAVMPDIEVTRWEKLKNRPVILWGPKTMAIVPYQPETMGNDEVFKAFMPDLTDVFMGGVWLVHEGIPRKREDMNTFAAKDIQDARRRAFIGINSVGQIVLGASKQSCSSAQLAEAISAAGIMEAVLLDSGFSTSLVYGEKIMASGHSTPTTPSRPVPHAIVLKGTLDPASKKAAAAAVPATRDESSRRRRRRR
jgi:peptidoglycan/xylan/chitin deacetylase (PgdA/CDA1 family)